MPAAAAASDSRGASRPAPTLDPTTGRDKMWSIPWGFGAGGGASANELSAASGAPNPDSNPRDTGDDPLISDILANSQQSSTDHEKPLEHLETRARATTSERSRASTPNENSVAGCKQKKSE